METKQQQPLAEQHILMRQEIAELKIQLKAALLLLANAECLYKGDIEREWNRQHAELMESVSN